MTGGHEPRAMPKLGAAGLVVDDRYRLEELLGAGGFGEVWRATQEVEGESVRAVALKLMPAAGTLGEGTPAPASGSDGSHDWLNEVRAVRELRCESVTTIYDVGVAREPRVAFIAMELLHGQTLAQRLERGPIYWRRALAIARDIAAALDACHRVDVFHCDLKPQNVFLTATGRVCVVDFGIASLGAESPRRNPGAGLQPSAADATGAMAEDELPDVLALGSAGSHRVLGTPGYIPPEGYGGEAPGAASDAYALGVLLYQSIAGRLPYGVDADGDATTAHGARRLRTALAAATTRGDLVPLASAAPDTPQAVLSLVGELLALEPSARPSRELLARFEDVWQRPHGPPDPPYIGLESFDERRSGYIAGRDADIAAITSKLANARAIVLSGPSGCGKSSLAVAGVTARIDQELLDGRDGWHAVIIRPTTGRDELQVVAAATSNADRLVGTVVVIDQLEEVLALEEAARTRMCDALATLAEGSGWVRVGAETFGPGDPIKVVATVRDDLFGRVAALPELRRVPEQNLYTVRGVEPNAVAEIVAGPARRAAYGLEHEAEVVAEATTVLHDDPSALPLVQFALTRWWEERDQDRRILPEAAWRSIGGIEGALAEAAQTLYDSLSEAERTHLRAVLLQLFRADGTRVRVAEDEVAHDPAARRLLEQRLVRRLVRRHVDADDRATLEVVHEALGRRWPLLRSWLEETRAERELLQYVALESTRWERAGRPAEMLWAGDRLIAALRHEAQAGDARPFIRASERHERRRRTLRRMLIAVAFAVLGAAVVLLALGYRDAEDARDRAETAYRTLEDERAARTEVLRQYVEQRAVLEAKAKEIEEMETEAERLRQQRDLAEKQADLAKLESLRAQLRETEQRKQGAKRDLQKQKMNEQKAYDPLQGLEGL